jgi:ferric-dicitrate binding protein FerR (iron transport regulator)
MTSDERRVVSRRRVASTESLRTLALRHVAGPAANEVARRVHNELSRLSPESIAGTQDLWAHADRLVRYRAIDLIKEQESASQRHDVADSAVGDEANHSMDEEDRGRLRAAVRQLDPQQQTVIAAFLQGRCLSRGLSRWGVGVETARKMERRSLAKLREILSGTDPVSVEQSMEGDQERSDVNTATQALDWVIDLHTAEEMAWLLPEFHAWLSAEPANRREYDSIEAIWRRLPGLHDRRLLSAMELPTRGTLSQAARTIAARESPTRAPVLLAARALLLVAVGISLYASSPEGALRMSQCDIGTDRHERTCRPWQERIVSGNEDTPALDLVDGSQIGLLANSQVTLDLTDQHRHISVDRGGAWFHVVHKANSPFEVRASAATVLAVGTRFSVQLTGVGGVKTVVQEGEVKVLVANRPPVLLAVGQSAEVDAGGVHLTSAVASDVDQPIMGTQGSLKLDGLTLEQAAQIFNRYNRHKIKVDEDVAYMRIRGQFPSTDPDGFAQALRAFGIDHSESRDPRSGAEIIQLSRKKAHNRSP